MKRLAFLVIIIALPILVYFQYSNYERFHPPSTYDYVINDSIDVHYHDQSVLQQYYKNAFEIGTFARSSWRTYEIDVQFPDQEDEQSRQAVEYYQQLLTTTAHLEDVLIYSKGLKDKGFDNQQIAEIEKQGISPRGFLLQQSGLLQGLERGDKGEAVWELQRILQQKGYDLPVDGVFDVVTEDALKKYQQAEELYPSGKVDASSHHELIRSL
ncbi:hypothetical protein OKW21_000084 [Catalinimonas alkaloidigena]|uniref:peptidoglycan-binding domain-containing protein n=1 Tax=Catalinimonas alkaloidigena TaxID=1075417 RepID=UPI002405E21B|nr:peptidoglycan-binding domain-containing protein [Catalinimonas alkaloidigena]MDF9794821.1 hypothetical protein [Catalinimonas alkaloidigena]